jgi:hypothetical protein
MGLLPPEMLPAVPHVVFGVFDLATPNLIVWLIAIGIFLIAAWARLPKFFEPRS